MKPINLRIQNYYPQTGIVKNPLVMWKYGPGSKRQTAYEIALFLEGKCIYTTGKVLSGEQNGIVLPWVVGTQKVCTVGEQEECNAGVIYAEDARKGCPVELTEQTKYEYQVRVWDEADQEYCSDRAFFVTGVEKWQGKWIGNGTAKPFLAKKSFYVKSVSMEAVAVKDEEEAGSGVSGILSLCVPGQFEVRINGEKISPYVYEGSQTDFNKHVHYSTYDVSHCLREGENELTVEVANGWYIGDDEGGKRYFYTMDKGYEAFGQYLSMLAQLQIAYADGKRDILVSDEDWQVSPSKTVLADIYGSEDMDYTREYAWQQASIVEGPRGEVIPFDYPPVIEKQCFVPRESWKLDGTTTIFDFGQNMSSQFEIRIRGKRGQVVKVIPAEKLGNDGTKRDIEPTVPTYSLLTLSGGEDIFRQKFSLNGARWYKVEGVEEDQILEFSSYFVTSSAQKSGYFHCSDERINGIFHIIENAVDSNLNHSHTDCPTIEKLGWLEPNHLMGKAVMYLKDADMMWSKIAQDMRDAQYGEDEFDLDNGAFPHEYRAGLVPSIAPRYARFITDWKEGSFWDIIPWGSSIILAAYEQYLFYGNTRVLRENYQTAKRYIQYLTEQYNDYNRLYGKSGEYKFICAGLGDWGIAQNKGRSRENVETAFYYRDLKVMAKIAKVLSGDMVLREREAFEEKKTTVLEAETLGVDAEELAADAEKFEKQAKEVCQLYNKALLVVEGDKAYYRAYDLGEEFEFTQANQAIPLYFGMVPKEKRAGVEKTLVKLCEGKHLVCGEVGLVYILRSLAKLGRNDIIFDMITREQHPSYLRFVNQGETTLPEFWRDDARSRNHDMMGHIMEWFFAEVAGIQPVGEITENADKPVDNDALKVETVGFKTVRIAPACKGLIRSFRCEYDSVRGKIKVVYDGENLTVETPHNMRVIVCEGK